MYLSAATVFKDETRWLREWVEYHRLIGVEHFYTVCNDDDPEPARRELAAYIGSGLVTFRHAKPCPKLQEVWFKLALEAMGRRTYWIAFLDLDEFVLPKGPYSSLSELLRKRYESVFGIGGLAVHWKVFNSSGHEKHPKGKLQIEAYTSRLRDRAEFHATIKSIVRADVADRPVGSHAWLYKPGFRVVNEYWETVKAGHHQDLKVSHDWVQVNHYMTRSRADYERKIARGWPPGGGAGISIEERWKIWNALHPKRQCREAEISTRFSRPVSKALGL